jgi:hypothetical protein
MCDEDVNLGYGTSGLYSLCPAPQQLTADISKRIQVVYAPESLEDRFCSLCAGLTRVLLRSFVVDERSVNTIGRIGPLVG